MGKIGIPARIRSARIQAALSQRSLAERLRVSRGAVANWECTSAALPAMQHLQAIAVITGVSFEWLATGRGPMASPPPDGSCAVGEDEWHLIAAFRTLPKPLREQILSVIAPLAGQPWPPP
ncbi:helix-turn-helix transcriptional regulator [Stenotrophomonas rhizophila]|nr:helix-turn-helix transcriptional regulator [Stenotrophomonas rhizophila]MCC7662492.1 helix-turn-helix transcriptional regulator [Stenotrophomonas rhizophila]